LRSSTHARLIFHSSTISWSSEIIIEGTVDSAVAAGSSASSSTNGGSCGATSRQEPKASRRSGRAPSVAMTQDRAEDEIRHRASPRGSKATAPARQTSAEAA
jgi:hypothetical protein